MLMSMQRVIIKCKDEEVIVTGRKVGSAVSIEISQTNKCHSRQEKE